MGAIALAIKDERPDARVLATEVYPDAMEWAKRNREENEIDVELIACDLMSGVPSNLEGEVDVIVADPPYVAELDRLSLRPLSSITNRMKRSSPEATEPGDQRLGRCARVAET